MAFPTLPSGNELDSAKFSVELQDSTMRQEVEGGYAITRPRSTRRSRKLFKCGFTCITEADRQALMTFWDSVAGNAKSFTWVSPQDNVTYTVRFKGTLSFKYTGVLALQRWDCDFQLEQV